MGQYLDFCGRHAAPLVNTPNTPTPRRLRWRSFVFGAGFWLFGAIVVVLLAFTLQSLIVFTLMALLPVVSFPYTLAWLAALPLAILLKPLFAWRMLAAEVAAVDAALAQSLDAGRARLAYLVSRDTSALSAEAVREAAIETLAENFNDSVVAPLFWFCIGGLPAAALYRFANTADASWGYRGERDGRDWTDAGCFAARADDVLSWLPARLTALIIFIAPQAGLTPENAENSAKNTLKNIKKNATLTPSPNSGWPMAAAALALNLRLGKAGIYTLNPQGQDCGAGSVQQALTLMRRCWRGLLLGVALACSLAWAFLLFQNWLISTAINIGGRIWN
jgi:adenosylcobinamide-phosphate synthase